MDEYGVKRKYPLFLFLIAITWMRIKAQVGLCLGIRQVCKSKLASYVINKHNNLK